MKRFFQIVSWNMVVVLALLLAAPSTLDAEAGSTVLKATVADESARYYVEIPETIAFGELSIHNAKEISYPVSFRAGNLDGGKVEISAQQTGNLIGKDRSSVSTIPFENRFTQVSLTESKELTGYLYVGEEAAASAREGAYRGTINFTFRYTPENKTPAKPDGNQNNGDDSNNNQESGSTGTTNGKINNNTYLAKLSLRKSTDINSISMCNSLFFGYADLVVKGSNTKITMYVIDPIPLYPEEGTPLSDVSFEAYGKKYAAKIDSSKQVIRHYEAASGFITDAGKYTSSVMTVTVPTKAIENSPSGALQCSAYVSAVMKSTQSFYIVLSDLKAGSTSEGLIPPDASSGTDPSGDGGTQSASEPADTLDPSKLSDGIYHVPVSALKETAEEASMMDEYLYPYAQLEVADKKIALTIHVQQKVAGIDGGGPEYISYEGVKAEKKTDLFTEHDIGYDSFTFALGDKLATPMLVTMLVKAMSMEVKARLVLDISQIKEGTAEGKAISDKSSKKSTENTKQSIEEENRETEKGKNAGTESLLIREIIWISARSMGIKILLVLIASVLLAISGYAVYLKYRRVQ